MENSLLYRAAKTWDRLSNYCYRLTYGYKMNLYTITLSFSSRGFAHVAGFQYLKDLELPRYTPEKQVARILEGKITQKQIENGIQYTETVEPRLLAVTFLEEILDNEFTLCSFTARFCQFTTQIKANYLISSNASRASFVFLTRVNKDKFTYECICTSAFLKGGRDFEANQRPYALLKKVKVCLADGSEEVLFQKNGFKDTVA